MGLLPGPRQCLPWWVSVTAHCIALPGRWSIGSPCSAMTAHYFAKYDYFVWILSIGFFGTIYFVSECCNFYGFRWMHGGDAKGLPGGQTSVVPTWGPTPNARRREDIPFVSPKLYRKWGRPAPPQESRIWAAKIFFRFVQSALKEAKYSKRFYPQFI